MKLIQNNRIQESPECQEHQGGIIIGLIDRKYNKRIL